MRTCLIDKTAFPRDKLCGGLVSGRSKGVFEAVFRRSWDEKLFVSSDRLRFYFNNRFLADNNGYSTLYFTMRKKFDNYLLEIAREASVDLRLNAEIVNVDLQNNMLQLKTGESLAFRFLIGADGVNSQIAKALFGAALIPRQSDLALRWRFHDRICLMPWIAWRSISALLTGVTAGYSRNTRRSRLALGAFTGSTPTSNEALRRIYHTRISRSPTTG